MCVVSISILAICKTSGGGGGFGAQTKIAALVSFRGVSENLEPHGIHIWIT